MGFEEDRSFGFPSLFLAWRGKLNNFRQLYRMVPFDCQLLHQPFLSVKIKTFFFLLDIYIHNLRVKPYPRRNH